MSVTGLPIADQECPATTDNACFADHIPNKCEKGDISEALFEIEAQRRGWLVASGRGKGRDFDSIIKRPSLIRPISVQVKMANWNATPRGHFRYTVKCSGSGPYSSTAFDVLAVHLPDSDRWVFYKREEIGNRIGIVYLPPEFRKKAVRRDAITSRDPDNWELLDEVAQSFK